MKRMSFFVLLFFHVSVVLFCNAQSKDSIRKWTIQECFQYAKEHNIQINSLRLNKESSEQDFKTAKGNRIPFVSASLTNALADQNYENTGGHLSNQLAFNSDYGFSSSLVLWNDHYIRNTIRQKNLLIETADLSVRESLNTMSLMITQAFLSILLTKENLTYITDLVHTSQALQTQGKQFYDAGSIAKKDLYQLKAQLASDNYLLVQNQNSLQFNLLTLKQLLQLPADTLFDIDTPDSVEVINEIPSLPDARQYALEHFPEIKNGQLRLEISQLEIAKAKAGFKPHLSANGSVGSGYNEYITHSSISRTNYFRQNEINLYQHLGITLSIPIFSNQINSTNLQKANIAFNQAKLNTENINLILSQTVEKAYLNAMNARQAFDAAKDQLTYATESYRIVNEQYKLGGMNSYELIQQRNQYVLAVQSYTQAKYNSVLLLKIYEFYLGKPVTF